LIGFAASKQNLRLEDEGHILSQIWAALKEHAPMTRGEDFILMFVSFARVLLAHPEDRGMVSEGHKLATEGHKLATPKHLSEVQVSNP
jgi:hypothetical protein